MSGDGVRYLDPADVLGIRVDDAAPWSTLGASGYGTTATRYALRVRGADGRARWRRVYVTVLGNGGVLHLNARGPGLYLPSDLEHDIAAARDARAGGAL